MGGKVIFTHAVGTNIGFTNSITGGSDSWWLVAYGEGVGNRILHLALFDGLFYDKERGGWDWQGCE